MGEEYGGRRAGVTHAPAILCHQACKPGSVPRSGERGDGHSSGAPLARHLVQPTRAARLEMRLAGLPAAPPLFGLAPGGVCRAAPVARRAVRSYRTLSPLPADPSLVRQGGLLSVALSLGSPPPEVIRHRISMEPGLSSPPADTLALAERPSGLLTRVIRGFGVAPSRPGSSPAAGALPGHASSHSCDWPTPEGGS